MQWMKTHKAPIGAAFVAAAAWAAKGCEPVLTIDIPQVVHVSCTGIAWGLSIVGAFLVGGGIINSDDAAKAKRIARG